MKPWSATRPSGGTAPRSLLIVPGRRGTCRPARSEPQSSESGSVVRGAIAVQQPRRRSPGLHPAPRPPQRVRAELESEWSRSPRSQVRERRRAPAPQPAAATAPRRHLDSIAEESVPATDRPESRVPRASATRPPRRAAATAPRRHRRQHRRGVRARANKYEEVPEFRGRRRSARPPARRRLRRLADDVARHSGGYDRSSRARAERLRGPQYEGPRRGRSASRAPGEEHRHGSGFAQGTWKRRAERRRTCRPSAPTATWMVASSPAGLRAGGGGRAARRSSGAWSAASPTSSPPTTSSSSPACRKRSRRRAGVRAVVSRTAARPSRRGWRDLQERAGGVMQTAATTWSRRVARTSRSPEDGTLGRHRRPGRRVRPRRRARSAPRC